MDDNSPHAWVAFSRLARLTIADDTGNATFVRQSLADWLLAEEQGLAAWLLAESRWEAGYVRGMLAEATRHDRQPDLDGLEDAQALHQFPWEAHSE